jgi:GMP synthase-like glutamine amidotransferase
MGGIMRILVFQHIPVEHPGIFRDFLEADGHSWDAIELDAGETIPSLDGYDSLWVMGGPMDVWDEESCPWLIAEKAVIREAVKERAMPFLGLCLGHQLLADALGGRVAAMDKPEVGVMDVDLTSAGQRDPLFAGLPKTMRCLQWHGSEVVELPPGAEILARSPGCQVQAFRTGDKAYTLQCHVEITSATVSEWAPVPAYTDSLERTLGPGALMRLEADAAFHMAEFNRTARTLYDNFMRLLP